MQYNKDHPKRQGPGRSLAGALCVKGAMASLLDLGNRLVETGKVMLPS
jgi:hypothetical protein